MTQIDFLVGRAVVEVRDNGRIVFEVGAKPEPRLYADVGDAVCLDPRGVPFATGELVGRTVASVSSTNGVLQIRFTDGAMLRSEPDPSYEAWQVVGGAPQTLVVCLPGGELAVWMA